MYYICWRILLPLRQYKRIEANPKHPGRQLICERTYPRNKSAFVLLCFPTKSSRPLPTASPINSLPRFPDRARTAFPASHPVFSCCVVLFRAQQMPGVSVLAPPAAAMGAVEELLKEAGGCAVIDGGFATQLEALGADINDPLWSAACLISKPDLVKEVTLTSLPLPTTCLHVCLALCSPYGGNWQEASIPFSRHALGFACTAWLACTMTSSCSPATLGIFYCCCYV